MEIFAWIRNGGSASTSNELALNLVDRLDAVYSNCSSDSTHKRCGEATNFVSAQGLFVPDGFQKVTALGSCRKQEFAQLEAYIQFEGGHSHVLASFLHRKDGGWAFVENEDLKDLSSPPMCTKAPFHRDVATAKEAIRKGFPQGIRWRRHRGEDVADFTNFWGHHCAIESISWGTSTDEDATVHRPGCVLDEGFPPGRASMILRAATQGKPHIYVQFYFTDGTRSDILKADTHSADPETGTPLELESPSDQKSLR